MKNYIEGCRVPITLVGQVEVPRLIMGNHPYDGMSYISPERDAWNLKTFNRAAKVSEVLRYAIEQAGLTVTYVAHEKPALNRLHLQAIWEAEQDTEVEIGMVAHIHIPVMLDGLPVIGTRRSYATMYAHNERLAGKAFQEHLDQDPIIQRLIDKKSQALVTSDAAPPLTEVEAERFTIDYTLLEHHLGFYAGCKIVIVNPGAEVDLLAMTGRFDLIRECIGFLRRRFGTVVVSIHHAGVTVPLLEATDIEIDGYVTPVNLLGAYMNPTPEIALAAIREASKPIIAIKPLAGGRILGRSAFEYVFEKVGVAAAAFGMGTVEQVSETTKAAREVLGTK